MYAHTHTHMYAHTHTHMYAHTHTHTYAHIHTQNTGTHIHTSPPLSLNLHMSNANIYLTQTDQDNVMSNRPKHKTLSLNKTVSPQTVHTLVVVLKYQCERNLGITCSRHWTYSLESNSLRKGYIVMPYSTETRPTQTVLFHKCHTPLKANQPTQTVLFYKCHTPLKANQQHRQFCFTSVILHWHQTNTDSPVSQVAYSTKTKPTTHSPVSQVAYSIKTKPTTQTVLFHKCHTPLTSNQHRQSCFTSGILH